MYMIVQTVSTRVQAGGSNSDIELAPDDANVDAPEGANVDEEHHIGGRGTLLLYLIWVAKNLLLLGEQLLPPRH
jgi:hypothetical protein